MAQLEALPLAHRALPAALYVAYVVTAVRPCRFATWNSEGQPNPFLPRNWQPAIRRRNLERAFA